MNWHSFHVAQISESSMYGQYCLAEHFRSQGLRNVIVFNNECLRDSDCLLSSFVITDVSDCLMSSF